MNSLSDFLFSLGLSQGQHVLLHASYKKFQKAFPNISIEELLNEIKRLITPAGSLVMPVFTYCFKKSDHLHEIFDQHLSVSKVGAVSEVFRKMPGIIRTASPTHSFALWGKVTGHIGADNNPTSPLGNESVLNWFAGQPDAYIFLLGVSFSSMSFGHYIEIKSGLLWKNCSPWKHLNILEIGVSSAGEYQLQEIPGCSKSFINFENYLKSKARIIPFIKGELSSYFVPVELMLTEGIEYFKSRPEALLCPLGSCAACDERWDFYLHTLRFSGSH